MRLSHNIRPNKSTIRQAQLNKVAFCLDSIDTQPDAELSSPPSYLLVALVTTVIGEVVRCVRLVVSLIFKTEDINNF